MVDVGSGDVEIVYAIQLLRVVQSGSSFAPDFTTAWQSHPNSAATQPGGVRSYSYGSTVEPSVSVDALPSSPAVSLVVRTDGLAGPAPEAAPGSTVWLDATVTFVEGSTSSSALSITWPRDDLLYVEQVVSVVSSSTNLTTSTAGGWAGVLSGAVITDASGQVDVSLGDVLNVDTQNSVVESVVVTLRGYMPNASTTLAGQSMTAAADFTSTAVSVSAPGTAVLSVVEPVLDPTSVVSPLAVTNTDAGDIVPVTVLVRHGASSTGHAHNVTLYDSELLAGRYGIAAVYVDGMSVAVQPRGTSGYVVEVPVLAEGAVSNVTILYRLDVTVEAGSYVQPSYSLSWLSHPVGVSGPGAIARAYSTALVNQPSIAQRDPVLGVGWSSDGSAPTVGDVVVGSELEVQLALAVPEGTTSDAVLWLQSDLADVWTFTVLSVVDASTSSSLSSSCAGGLAGRASGGDVVTNSTTALVPLCTLTNVNTNNSISEPVVVTVRAVVRDTAVVARGGVVSLTGYLSSAANSTSVVVSSWTIREPSTVSPVVASVPSPVPVLEAGDLVQYSVSPTHAGVSDGIMYNWTLTDSTLADGRYYVNRV